MLNRAMVLVTGHPHAGGEIDLGEPLKGFEPGPSPRGWGNLIKGLTMLSVFRAIPTRVGKSARRL